MSRAITTSSLPSYGCWWLVKFTTLHTWNSNLWTQQNTFKVLGSCTIEFFLLHFLFSAALIARIEPLVCRRVECVEKITISMRLQRRMCLRGPWVCLSRAIWLLGMPADCVHDWLRGGRGGWWGDRLGGWLGEWAGLLNGFRKLWGSCWPL